MLLIFKQTSLPRSLYSPVTPVFSLGAVLGQFEVAFCMQNNSEFVFLNDTIKSLMVSFKNDQIQASTGGHKGYDLY